MDQLELTKKQFEDLHQEIDGARTNAKNLKVDYKTIINLLMDWSHMKKLLGPVVTLKEKENDN